MQRNRTWGPPSLPPLPRACPPDENVWIVHCLFLLGAYGCGIAFAHERRADESLFLHAAPSVPLFNSRTKHGWRCGALCRPRLQALPRWIACWTAPSNCLRGGFNSSARCSGSRQGRAQGRSRRARRLNETMPAHAACDASEPPPLPRAGAAECVGAPPQGAPQRHGRILCLRRAKPAASACTDVRCQPSLGAIVRPTPNGLGR